MNKRSVYYVSPQGNDWAVKKRGDATPLAVIDNKELAIKRAKSEAKSQPLSQVIIQKRDGKFQTEHTYGQDPRPPGGSRG